MFENHIKLIPARKIVERLRDYGQFLSGYFTFYLTDSLLKCDFQTLCSRFFSIYKKPHLETNCISTFHMSNNQFFNVFSMFVTLFDHKSTVAVRLPYA